MAPKGFNRQEVANVVVSALENSKVQANLQKIKPGCPVEVLVYKNPDMIIGIKIPDDCATAV